VVKSFDKLNVSALYSTLADILGEKHNAKITYSIKKKEEAEL
jgi:hypothetical protein